MYCTKCGNKLNDADKFCSTCGYHVESFQKDEEVIIVTNNESKFEKFMSKHFYKNTLSMSIEELKKMSMLLSVAIVIMQFVRGVFIFFDMEIGILFVGDLFLILSDWYFLSRLGVKGKWKIWGVFLYPVYLLIKAKKTKQNYIWGFLCGVILLLSIGVSVGTSFYGGTEERNDQQDIQGDFFTKKESENINRAVQIVKQYFEYEYVQGYIGVSLIYSDIEIQKTDDDLDVVSFYMQKYNKFTDEYDEPYYVELTYDEEKILFGYNIKSFYEYLLELGYPLQYTVKASWDGEYLLINDSASYNEFGYEDDSELDYEISNGENNTLFEDSLETANAGIMQCNDANIELSNGMKVIIPDNWIGNCYVAESTNYITFYEASNYENITGDEPWFDGVLFYINVSFNPGMQIKEEESLIDYGIHEVIGYYYDDLGTPYGIVMEYPKDAHYNLENEVLSNNYFDLMETIDDVQFDTTEMVNVVETDEAELKNILSTENYY